MLSLDGLNEHTLANALAAVDGHVAQTCAGCPQGRSERGPSPLVYCPEFSAFLERALELARMRPDLGIAPPVLLLQASRGWRVWKRRQLSPAASWARPPAAGSRCRQRVGGCAGASGCDFVRRSRPPAAAHLCLIPAPCRL